ncbi:hypothetical protein [Microbacterium jepli]|uniref:hypothetical protein n=1 Tax=Microbacterium sp. 1P10UE TaxID=3132288 RepID=UPI00399FC80E
MEDLRIASTQSLHDRAAIRPSASVALLFPKHLKISSGPVEACQSGFESGTKFYTVGDAVSDNECCLSTSLEFISLAKGP